jgi:tetratricopeptide (TPR) repeat protein
MHARTALLLAALSALPGAGARADTPPAPPVASETMAGHRLKNIIEHQRILFADAAAQGKDLDEADFKDQVEQLTREYESLLRDSPEFAEGYADYGYMLWKVGLRKQAVAILLKANQLNPDIALVKNELGNYLAEDGKPLEALNYFLAAIKIEPAEPLYHYQLGTLLYEARDDFLKSGEWSRAAIDHSMMEAFRTAAELAPDRIEFTYRYAESFADMVDPDWAAALKAWEALEGKAKSDLERQTMRLQEANVLLNMGKNDHAAKVLEGVTEVALQEQKQKLTARLAPGADK